MLKNSLFLILFCLVFSGCEVFDPLKSTDVSASQIHQSYTIYGKKNGSTSVEAVFSVGPEAKDRLELVEPSKIEFNGQRMLKMEKGMFAKHADYYHSLFEFPSKQVFTFANASGGIETYEINLEPLEITDKDIEIDLSKGGELTLSRAVENDETVNVLFDSTVLPPPSDENTANQTPKPKYAWSFSAKLNADRTKIIVDSSSLDYFVSGKAKVYVGVTKEKKFDNSAKGAAIKSNYTSETVIVNVKN